MDLRKSMQAAVEFLIQARHPAGWWADFHLAPGASDEWVTAYVGTTLAQMATQPTLIKAVEAFCWLARRHTAGAGWGYNALTPCDADSTLWALQLADATGCGAWKQARQARLFLRQHLRHNGGIATYANDAQIRRFINAPADRAFTGWCGAQPCVTAAAAALTDMRVEVANFLRSTQCEDGHWSSYWWCEDEYATALAAEALATGTEPHDPERVQKAIQWAWTRIQADGSVPSPIRPTGSAFATAWVLRILLLDGDHQLCSPLLQWLLRQQLANGAWPPSAGLRVPQPDTIRPDHDYGWHLNGLVEGSIAVDQNGLFTTATVLQAITRTFSNQQVSLLPPRL